MANLRMPICHGTNLVLAEKGFWNGRPFSACKRRTLDLRAGALQARALPGALTRTYLSEQGAPHPEFVAGLRLTKDMKTRKRSPLSPHMLSLFTTTPGKAGSSSPTRGGREEKRSAHSGYAPSASPGLSWGGRPQPIEVSASVALSPAGAGRASGLSQWAIGMNSPPNMENAGGSGAKPPEPVLSSHKSQAASDGRLQKALAMLADSDRLMPWVKRMEIGPGLIFTGFVDEHGVPDVFGYIKYYGHDDDVVLNAIPQAHRLHVSTHYECSFGATHSKRQLRHTARHDIRPVSSLPSVVTNIVHRQAIATKQVLAVFIGEIRKGHRHGLGRIKFHSGREYAGQWDQDQAQGVGVERRADKSKYYGHLARWRRHGYGLSIQGHQEGGSGYATTEGLFTDGREDLCTVRGYMQADRFQVTRRDFVSMHFDCIISSEAFDPCVREHMDLVGEADAAFQRAVEAERGANVIVNLVLHLDDTCTRFIKTGEPVPSAHADPARAHNFCSRSYEESSLLKDVWVDTLAAGSYTELVYGSLLSHLRRAAASSFDTHAPGSLFQSEASEANSLPARHDLPNVNSDIDLRLQLCLRENFEIISSTRAGLMAFERNLCREIATAVGIPLDRFAILATGPSDASVAVLLLILADALGPAPAVIGERLTAQLSFAGSSLRNGSLSRKVFRCTPYERRVTERCSNSQYPHIKAHLSQTTLFPWHIDHFGSVANDVPVVSIFDSTFRRQSFDGRRPAGSNASNVPTKYQVSCASRLHYALTLPSVFCRATSDFRARQKYCTEDKLLPHSFNQDPHLDAPSQSLIARPRAL